MPKHMCHLTLVSVLIIALAAALLGCGKPSAEAPPPAAAGQSGAGQGREAPAAGPSGQDRLAQLGITGRVSQTDPQGLLVTGFLPSSEPCPLQVIGVKAGDTIISLNGEQKQIGGRLADAIEALQTQGEPITLGIMRGDEKMRIERTEKLPVAETNEKPE